MVYARNTCRATQGRTEIMNTNMPKRSLLRLSALASSTALILLFGSTSCTKAQSTKAKTPTGGTASSSAQAPPIATVKRCSLEADADGKYPFPSEFTLQSALPAGWTLENGNITAPAASTNELIGGNFQVGSRAESPILMQVLLLPANVPPNVRQRVTATSMWPACTPSTESSAGSQATDGKVGTADRRVHWFFVTEKGTGESVTVQLPKTETGEIQYHCIPDSTDGGSKGEETVALQGGASLEIQVATDQGCAETEVVTVHLLASDALAKPKNEIFENPKLSPIDEKNLELQVESVLARTKELRAKNSFSIRGKAGELQGSVTTYDPTSKSYVLRLASATRIERQDFPLDVELASPGRTRVSEGKLVFRASDGQRLYEKDAELWTLTRVRLPSSLPPIGISPEPKAETRISIDPRLSLFVRDGMSLDCKTPNIAKCAVVHRNSTAVWVTIENDAARKALRTSGQSLIVEFKVPDDLDSNVVVDGDASKAIEFKIETHACRYSLRQLTHVVAGVSEARVLYLVKAHRPGCMNAPLALRSADQSSPLPFVESNWWTPERTDKGVLAVSFGRIESLTGDKDTRSYPLAVRQAADGDDVEIEGDTRPTLVIDRGPDVLEMSLAVQTSPEGATKQSLMKGQPFVGVGLVNELSLRPAIPAIPWHVRLRSLGTYAPVTPPAAVPGATIVVPFDERELPRITDGAGTRYTLTAQSPSETAPPLRADFSAPVDQLLLGDGTASILENAVGKDEYDRIVHERLDAGYTPVVLPAQAKRYWLPWDLRDAAIVCEGSCLPKKDYVLGRGHVTQGLRRGEYTGCKLVVPVEPDQLTLSQKLVVRASTEGGKVKSGIVDEVRETDFKTGDATLCQKLPTKPSHCKVFDLSSLLHPLEGPSAYTAVTITVAHPANEAEQSPTLSNTHVPVEGVDDRFERARRSTLTVKTRIMPGVSVRFPLDGDRDTWGMRAYLSLAAGLSVVNTNPGAYGVETSTTYSKNFQSRFDYGGLIIIEPWNFSENNTFPFSPQFMIGGLGPQTKRPTYWNDVTFVTGLGLRMPTSSTPGSSPFEAGTSVILWYAGNTGGRDNRWVHSLLFGANLSFGSFP